MGQSLQNFTAIRVIRVPGKKTSQSTRPHPAYAPFLSERLETLDVAKVTLIKAKHGSPQHCHGHRHICLRLGCSHEAQRAQLGILTFKFCSWRCHFLVNHFWGGKDSLDQFSCGPMISWRFCRLLGLSILHTLGVNPYLLRKSPSIEFY